MKKKLLSLALALVLSLSLAVPAFAAEKDKTDAAPTETAGDKKDETPAEGEEKKDEAEAPAEGEEKKDEAEAPAEGEEKKDEAEAPTEGGEKKDEAPAAPKFTDVAANSPFAAAIDWAVAEGITTGKTETTFGPGETCTVNHILTFLWRANGKPGAAEGVKDFDAAVKWAVEKEIYVQDEPSTGMPCTRELAVTFMWKAAGSPEVKTEKSFTDVASDAESAGAIAWAVENGVTAGTGDGTTFEPGVVCTRGQIVTFLFRANQAAAAPAEGEASK